MSGIYASLRQAQILILEILNVFLWLKFSPSLTLNKIEHFSKVSLFVCLANRKLEIIVCQRDQNKTFLKGLYLFSSVFINLYFIAGPKDIVNNNHHLQYETFEKRPLLPNSGVRLRF